MSLTLQTTFNKKMAEVYTPYYEYVSKWIDFTTKYNSAFFEASAKAFESFLGVSNTTVQKIQSTIRSSFDATIRERLNEDDLASSMAEYIDSWIKLVGFSEYKEFSANFYNFISYVNKMFEPLRDSINRTPSEVIEIRGRFDLLHYKSDTPPKHKTPLLIVGSLINRHYILDLLPKVSIVKNLQSQGFDIYATDWKTPAAYDKDLTLERYAEEYVGNAVEKIKEITGSQKVSLLGYCWGGIFSLIYSDMNQNNVKNLILHATPIDIEKEKTIIENWTAHFNADNFVNTFGNVPGWFVNLAFILRNPVENMLKYPRYFSEPRTIDELMQFFSIETWLYDSRPIIGEVYREIVDQIYRKNLMIKNKMKVGSDTINLANITVPVLDIVGTKDDLVPPSSSTSIMNVIGSTDKRLIEFPTGHVGLCIGQSAHEKLWPEVGEWLAKRS
ncbi:Poly(3-hydroxyalkanoate) polymerase subunit PhaC [uncultured archaeon]|nr:Poly(3-hydroxyalkanoate) polymerase subunit PhaC [uncultured archaeon]